MTRYTDKRRVRKDDDTPISLPNYEEQEANESRTYYCKNCQRALTKLIDSSGQNPSWFCNNCTMEVIPSITELRAISKVETPQGFNLNQEAYVSYTPEPSIGRGPVKPQGVFSELQKKGIKITDYNEHFPKSGRTRTYHGNSN